MLKRLIVALSAVGAVAWLAAAPAVADQVQTYDLDVCQATGGCNNAPTPYGTVGLDLSNDLHTITITVTPSAGNGFVDTGSGYALAFDFSCGGCSLTLTLPDGSHVGDSNWGLCTSDCHADGTGTWNFGIDCTGACSNGGSNPLTTPITITLTSSSNLSLAGFGSNDNGYIFASDMCYGVVDGRCAGTTGDDAADGQTQQVPEPMTLSLFGVGILGAGLLRRRSKKRS